MCIDVYASRLSVCTVQAGMCVFYNAHLSGCVLVDVYAERPGLQGRVVQVLAQAQLRRRAWEPLAAVAEGFDRQVISNDAVHGGELWLACGRKPVEHGGEG